MPPMDAEPAAVAASWGVFLTDINVPTNSFVLTLALVAIWAGAALTGRKQRLQENSFCSNPPPLPILLFPLG